MDSQEHLWAHWKGHIVPIPNREEPQPAWDTAGIDINDFRSKAAASWEGCALVPLSFDPPSCNSVFRFMSYMVQLSG